MGVKHLEDGHQIYEYSGETKRVGVHDWIIVQYRTSVKINEKI